MKPVAMTLLALAVCSPLWADDFRLPPGKWWENPRLVEQISLTAEQQEQIRSLVLEHARRMIDLNAAVKRAELELGAVADQAPFDPAQARSTFAAFQNSRKGLEAERFELLLAVRQVLTVEQWKALREMRSERMRGERSRRDQKRRQNRPSRTRLPGNQPSRNPG